VRLKQPMHPKTDPSCLLVISEQFQELKQKLGLCQAPVRVLCASSGDEGLGILSEWQVEAVVLHLHSDWRPDVEILRHIRTFFACLPVVILAEESSLAGAEACAGLSTQGYLRLPVSAGELWRAVEAALFAYTGGEPRPARTTARRKEVEQALSLIHARHQEGLSAHEVALGVHMSRNHLGSLFKAETNHTLSEYISLCRVATALRLITREPDLGFAQVAGRSGFSSESYFSKVFKRLLDVSPKDFRQMVLSGGPAAAARCQGRLQDLWHRQRKIT